MLKTYFTEAQEFAMFNVECDAKARESHRFNVKTPLWRVRRGKRGKGREVAVVGDNIKPGVSQHAPGTKGRVEDLVRFYAENAASETSAFTV